MIKDNTGWLKKFAVIIFGGIDEDLTAHNCLIEFKIYVNIFGRFNFGGAS